MKVVLDAEWYTPEGQDIVHGAEYLHCIVLKELGVDNWFEFVNGDRLNKTTLQFFAPSIDKMQVDTIICHNLLNADLHVFKKLLGLDFTVSPKMTLQGRDIKFIDTLSWSRRLWPDRPLPKGCPSKIYNPVTGKNDTVGPHGLGAWGYRVGCGKPVVHDWRNQPIETYLHRCKEDVKINELVYYKLLEEMK